MPVKINTNSAATVAANNLAATSAALQRSLYRLSSGSKIVNPADDAGGLAVSMKFSAAARRMGAAHTNISNSISYLQAQDGALSVTARVLDRISVLKTLSVDPTKNASDIANYNGEFKALQQELKAIGGETFNGRSLFGSSSMAVAVSEDQQQSVNLEGVDLLAAGTGSLPTPDLYSMDGWIDNSSGGTVSIAGGAMTLSGTTDISTKQTFAIPGNINFSFNINASSFNLYLGSTLIASESGTASTSIGIGIFSNAGYPPGPLRIQANGPVTITDLNIAMTQDDSGASNTYLVANAGGIASLDLSTITGAIQDVATHRASNGANQSRLGFSMELLTTNKVNIEQATSRIVDVDVADESTALAKSNVLVQAGSAMLTQANQAPSNILRLLG